MNEFESIKNKIFFKMWDDSYTIRPTNMSRDAYCELNALLLSGRMYDEIYTNIKEMILLHTRVFCCKPTRHLRTWAVVGHERILVDD